MVDISGVRWLAKSVMVTGVRAMALPVTRPNEGRLTLIGLALLALLSVRLRLMSIVIEPSIDWCDEVFQPTEQAHRLAHGHGLVPGEFQLGMRSWLLPGFVAGVMEMSRLIEDGPGYYLPAIATVFGLLASTSVICCSLWAGCWYSLSAALAGAAIVVIAPKLIYFGSRALSEVVAAHAWPLSVALPRTGGQRRTGAVATRPDSPDRADALANRASLKEKFGAIPPWHDRPIASPQATTQ